MSCTRVRICDRALYIDTSYTLPVLIFLTEKNAHRFAVYTAIITRAVTPQNILRILALNAYDMDGSA